MKKFNLLFMALFITLFVVSCSDSDSDPNGTDDDGVLKLTTGSYWIMENYDLKSDGTKDESTVTMDSSYVGIADLIDNVSYLPYITKYEEAEEDGTIMTMMDTIFFKVDKNKLYALMNTSDEDFMGIFKEMIVFADWDATSAWTVMDIDTTVQQEITDSINITSRTNIKMTITPGSMSTITVNGESIAVKEFTMEINSDSDTDMYLNTDLMNTTQSTSKSVSHYFISKDKFVMHSTEDESIDTFTYTGGVEYDTTAASVSNVVRYHIQ